MGFFSNLASRVGKTALEIGGISKKALHVGGNIARKALHVGNAVAHGLRAADSFSGGVLGDAARSIPGGAVALKVADRVLKGGNTLERVLTKGHQIADRVEKFGHHVSNLGGGG